jgi:hypothetical protein
VPEDHHLPLRHATRLCQFPSRNQETRQDTYLLGSNVSRAPLPPALLLVGFDPNASHTPADPPLLRVPGLTQTQQPKQLLLDMGTGDPTVRPSEGWLGMERYLVRLANLREQGEMNGRVERTLMLTNGRAKAYWHTRG